MDNAISPQDREALRVAQEHLEHPSLAARLTSVVGTPIEQGLKLLPKRWYDRLHSSAEEVIRRLLDTAIHSMGPHPGPLAHVDYHKVLAMTSGAAGGFFGLPALIIELPVSTTIMLRAIADVAHANGEALDSVHTRMACMEVFALGGRSKEDDAADTGYYGLRGALALHFSTVKGHLAHNAVAAGGVPGSIKLVAAIAARFGVPVTEKAAVQMVPLVGAAGGALVNAIFMQHFQDMASGHFTIRRLERKYGSERVRAEYTRIAEAG